MVIGQYLLQPKEKEDSKLMRKLDFIGVVIAVAQLFVSLRQIWNPVFAWTGLFFALTVLAWVGRNIILLPLRRLRAKSKDAAFIREHMPTFKELLERFRQHASESASNQIFILFRSSLNNDSRAFQTVFASRALASWLNSFQLRFELPCDDINEFLLRCRDLTLLVHHFNTDYVLRSRQELQGANSPTVAAYVDQLEAFRVEFTRFLQDVELWSKRVNDYTLQRFGHKKFSEIALSFGFARVGSFAKAESAKA